jgi:hypothetical protein
MLVFVALTVGLSSRSTTNAQRFATTYEMGMLAIAPSSNLSHGPRLSEFLQEFT